MSEETQVRSFESMHVTHDAMVVHLVSSILGADIIEVPFPHLVIDGVLPTPVFEALLSNLPRPESMPAVGQKGWSSVAQYNGQWTSLFGELDVPNPEMWQVLEDALLDHEVERATIDKLMSWIPPSALGRPLHREVRLDCTTGGAFLKPHTDHPVSFVKQLIYLTPLAYDNSLDTLLYAPRDPAVRLSELGPTADFSYDEYQHESPEAHLQAGRVRHRPNRMFVFLRSVNSLHGLGPLHCSTPRFVISVHRQFASS